MEDYYTQRRGWVRLEEKGGKRHEMPVHHNLGAYFEAYIERAGLAKDRTSWRFGARQERGSSPAMPFWNRTCTA